MAMKKSKNAVVFVIYSNLKSLHLELLKGMQSSKLAQEAFFFEFKIGI